MNEVPTIAQDTRTIASICYPDDSGHYAGGETVKKIVAYEENGQMAPVPYFAVYDYNDNITVRVPAQMVTVFYFVEDKE